MSLGLDWHVLYVQMYCVYSQYLQLVSITIVYTGMSIMSAVSQFCQLTLHALTGLSAQPKPVTYISLVTRHLRLPLLSSEVITIKIFV